MSRRVSIEVPELGHGQNPIPVATMIGNLLFTGGISGVDVSAGRLPEDAEAQCAHMFTNVRRVLDAAGATPEDVAKMTVFARDRSLREVLNREWVKMFPDPHSRPVRHLLVADLQPPMLVQCEIIAVLSE